MSNKTLDELLDSLGFDPWKTITATYGLFAFNLSGAIFGMLSAWTFSRRQFYQEPIFFYYRLLSLLFILHSLHNLPYAICYSPRYFPTIDTYVASIYMIANHLVSSFLFHYEEALQIAILLTRMKIFSPLVRSRFTASPRLVSLALFVACFLIDFTTVFNLEIVSMGEFYYVDEDNRHLDATLLLWYFEIFPNEFWSIGHNRHGVSPQFGSVSLDGSRFEYCLVCSIQTLLEQEKATKSTRKTFS
jgi:hypothetical protein